MQAGIDMAQGSIIATMDGDLQNNPADIGRMVRRLLDEDLDLLVGWRRSRQDSLWLRKVPSWCANRLIVAVTGVRLHDYGCSLKIFRASVIRQVRLYGEMHRFIPTWVATVTSPARIARGAGQPFPARARALQVWLGAHLQRHPRLAVGVFLHALSRQSRAFLRPHRPAVRRRRRRRAGLAGAGKNCGTARRSPTGRC